MLPRSRDMLKGGRSQVPTSLSFENPRGFNDYDPDFPIKQIKKELPSLILEHSKVSIFVLVELVTNILICNNIIL